MKTVREIPRQIILDQGVTSLRAAEILGDLVDRSKWTIYTWIAIEPAEPIVYWVNKKYEESK